MLKPGQEQVERPRRGRPRNDETGQVGERILDAATALFLAQGFGRTTLDQVSDNSHTGKTTLYGRYPNKESLFAAVVRRSIGTMFAELLDVPRKTPLENRLRHAGRELVQAYLVPRCVALIRITAAEAASFPDLARMAYDFSMAGSARYVAEAIADGGTDEAIETAMPMAQRFVEVALHSIAFRAIFGADPAALLATSSRDIDDAITLLFPDHRPDARLNRGGSPSRR